MTSDAIASFFFFIGGVFLLPAYAYLITRSIVAAYCNGMDSYHARKRAELEDIMATIQRQREGHD